MSIGFFGFLRNYASQFSNLDNFRIFADNKLEELVSMNRYKQARKNAGKTQQEAASIIGSSVDTIWRLESGKKQPKVDEVKKLAEFYNVSPAYLTGDSNMMAPASPAFSAILRDWIDEFAPDGIKVLSEKSGIIAEDIQKYLNGAEPTGSHTHRLMQAMGYEGVGDQPPTRRLKMERTAQDAPELKSNVRFGDFIEVPVLSMEMVASCGAGNGLYGVEAETTETVPVSTSSFAMYDDLRKPFSIRTDGDSMEGAGLEEGNIAVINPAEDIVSGDTALVVWNDNWFIKWVIWNPDGSVELRSANPTYGPIRVDREYAQDANWFRVIGKVVEIVDRKRPRRAF